MSARLERSTTNVEAAAHYFFENPELPIGVDPLRPTVPVTPEEEEAWASVPITEEHFINAGETF